MTKENDTPVEEETPPEEEEDKSKAAPKEGTKYDGGAIPR